MRACNVHSTTKLKQPTSLCCGVSIALLSSLLWCLLRSLVVVCGVSFARMSSACSASSMVVVVESRLSAWTLNWFNASGVVGVQPFSVVVRGCVVLGVVVVVIASVSQVALTGRWSDRVTNFCITRYTCVVAVIVSGTNTKSICGRLPDSVLVHNLVVLAVVGLWDVDIVILAKIV